MLISVLFAFELAKDLNARDGGKLWGQPVCGPIMFVDSATRAVMANQADAEKRLKEKDGVWQGALPASMNVANTAMEWGGVRWTTILWSERSDPRELATLIGHECYHRIQPAIGLPASQAIADHLDSRAGRELIQLEWRALERALEASGDARTAAIADALAFRAQRRAQIKDAKDSEIKLEINEGLAEYTGVTLAEREPADRRGAAIAALRDGPHRSSFARSFAYISGPAYGVLLDEANAQWRRGLKPDSDLGALLAAAYRAPTVAPNAARYGGDVLAASEKNREAVRRAEVLQIERRFAKVIERKTTPKIDYAFNPNGVVPLGNGRTYYPSLRVSDAWGVLEANDGAILVGMPPTAVLVPAPDPTMAAAWQWLKHTLPRFKEYKVISNDSAVVETWGSPGRETQTVFHQDKGELLLTHYCAQGNQARLKATAATKDSVTFELLDVTNRQPEQSVMIARTLRVDRCTLTVEETYEQPDGKADVSSRRFECEDAKNRSR